MRLVTIDPGKNMGWACFYDDVFVAAGVMWKSHLVELQQLHQATLPDFAIIEKPQVYPHGPPIDPNDLIEVALIAGAAGAILSQTAGIQFVRPHEWKGSRPKKVDNEYTLSLLRPAERELLERCKIQKGKVNNAIDAIGIALWKLGRR